MSIPVLYVELKSHKSCTVTPPQENWDRYEKQTYGYWGKGEGRDKLCKFFLWNSEYL